MVCHVLLSAVAAVIVAASVCVLPALSCSERFSDDQLLDQTPAGGREQLRSNQQPRDSRPERERKKSSTI